MHSKDNVDKMSYGVPWRRPSGLRGSRRSTPAFLDASERGQALVVGCSALKQQYRNVLAEGFPITWVYSKGSVELLRGRLKHRLSHFMKAGNAGEPVCGVGSPPDAIVADVSAPPGTWPRGSLRRGEEER